MEVDAVHAVAQGRVWTGTQALELGLVDELGGMDLALAKAAELAGIEGYGMNTYPSEKTFMEFVMEDLAEARTPTVALTIPGIPQEDLEQARLLRTILEDGVAAMVPMDIEFH
jgi:ClpP class serine protease